MLAIAVPHPAAKSWAKVADGDELGL